MPDWWDSVSGDIPAPAHPASRGATFGANYQALPDAQAAIEDRRSQGTDYTVGMRRPLNGGNGTYWPTDMPGVNPWGRQTFRGYDPLVASPLIANRGLGANTPGAYAPSFQQNTRLSRQPPSPNLPSPMMSNSYSDLPYIGAHLPWSPGDPGWTPPPARGMTINSLPGSM